MKVSGEVNRSSVMKPKSIGFHFLLLTLFLFSWQAEAQYMSDDHRRVARWHRQEQYQKMSREDGGYLFYNGGWRIESEPDKVESSYSNWSGTHGLNYGYRKSNLSYEIGLNFIYHSPDDFFYIPELDHNVYSPSGINSLIVPIGIRFNVPVGEKEKFRFGANFGVNWIAIPLGRNNESGKGVYYWQGDVPASDRLVYTWEADQERSRFFFKAGIHGELQFLKSSFLILQVSRAFMLNPAVTFNYEWTGKGQEGSFQVDSVIDGYMFEIAYKIPLKVLGAKLNKQIEP